VLRSENWYSLDQKKGQKKELTDFLSKDHENILDQFKKKLG
jgi:hypothetical protein